MMSDFVIREAVREDCHALRVLIQLANFEGMPDEPKIGAEELQRDGFDAEHPFFKCFVAELTSKDNTTAESISDTKGVVGYALFCNMYSTWRGPSLYLEDLYVTPSVRSKGVGSALFDRVVKHAYDSKCCRMDFTVLSWNPATEFYKRKGATDLTVSDKWHHFRLDWNAIEVLSTKGQKNT